MTYKQGILKGWFTWFKDEYSESDQSGCIIGKRKQAWYGHASFAVYYTIHCFFTGSYVCRMGYLCLFQGAYPCGARMYDPFLSAYLSY